MNEVDRMGEGITSLLYVYTFLSFVSADLSKKNSNLKYLSPYPPFKKLVSWAETKCRCSCKCLYELKSKSELFGLFQTPESDSPSTMCPAHPQLLSPLSFLYTLSRKHRMWKPCLPVRIALYIHDIYKMYTNVDMSLHIIIQKDQN